MKSFVAEMWSNSNWLPIVDFTDFPPKFPWTIALRPGESDTKLR